MTMSMSLESESDIGHAEESDWQNESRRCGVVLGEVFPWLGGEELARAGAACRAWRRAAAAPALWRRLLLLPPHPGILETFAWREEYVTACAGWKLEKQHVVVPGGVSLLHADLAPSHDALALSADDASLAVWRREHGTWCESWRAELRPRGWASVARVLWARTGPRLLLAGPRVLIDDWELIVLQLDEDYRGGCVLSRVRCSAGAAGCWADAGDTFLSLELRLVAPGIACTTVWSNAATQETQSEYVGVRSSLLRIFNEGGAHITHALVADTEPGGRPTLIAGSARGLGAWPVVEPRPPPLLAGAPGELAQRVQRRRAPPPPPPPPPQPPPPPGEASMRAACAPPDREWLSPAPLIGLVSHDSGRWVCAVCSDGSAALVCARTLTPLREWRWGAAPAPVVGPRHYVQPAVSAHYAASPAGGYSPRVWTWSLRSGVRRAVGEAGTEAGAGAGRHRGAAVCALLPRVPLAGAAALLTLAADSLYVWRSRATRQCSGETRWYEASEDEACRCEASEDESRRCGASEDEARRCEASEDEARRCGASEDEARRCGASEDEARRCGASEDEARRCEASEDEARRCEASEDEARRCEASEDEARRGNAADSRDSSPRFYY